MYKREHGETLWHIDQLKIRDQLTERKIVQKCVSSDTCHHLWHYHSTATLSILNMRICDCTTRICESIVPKGTIKLGPITQSKSHDIYDRTRHALNAKLSFL